MQVIVSPGSTRSGAESCGKGDCYAYRSAIRYFADFMIQQRQRVAQLCVPSTRRIYLSSSLQLYRIYTIRVCPSILRHSMLVSPVSEAAQFMDKSEAGLDRSR